MPWTKPCRLELNNSGAWKVLARFDAIDEDHTDHILNAAEGLFVACNGSLLAAGKKPQFTLRVSTDEGASLMHLKDTEHGWRDSKGDPA